MHRIATSAAVLALAAASPAAASPPSGEVVRDWNETANAQPFGNPLRLARVLAIMHAVQHDAVNGAAPRYETYGRFTGANAFRFCMTSTTSTPPGTHRCWRSFARAELENAESRVLVGFHFRFAIEAGVEVGRKIGRFAMRHALRPRAAHDDPPRVRWR